MVDTLTYKTSCPPFPDVARNISQSDTVKIANGGKNIKSTEDIVRCFLYCKVINVYSYWQVNIEYLREKKETMTEKYITFTESLYDIFVTKPTEEAICQVLREMTSDLSLISIIAGLSQFEASIIKKIYKIIKLFFKFGVNTELDEKITTKLLVKDARRTPKEKKCFSQLKSFALQVQNYLYDNAIVLLDALMANYRTVKNEVAIPYTGKLIRMLIHNIKLYEKILSCQYLSDLFFFTKSTNFIVSSEISKVLFASIDDNSTCEYFNKFLSICKEEFNQIVNLTLASASADESDFYFAKRETMKFLLRLLTNESFFFDFKEFYLSNKENLKLIMSLLNHSCTRIRYKAICILYLFYVEIEQRDNQIKVLMLNNKKNFEKYFDSLDERIYDSDVVEKKNYILYELERLQNLNIE